MEFGHVVTAQLAQRNAAVRDAIDALLECIDETTSSPLQVQMLARAEETMRAHTRYESVHAIWEAATKPATIV